MNAFVQAQEAIKTLLQANAFFSDIPIVTEAKGTITEEVAQSIAASGVAENSESRFGLSVVLRTPDFNNPDEGRIGLALQLRPKISIYENVAINQGPTGIGKPALDVVQAAIFLVHGKGIDRGPKNFVAGGTSEEADGVVAYHIEIASDGGISSMPT